MFQERIPSIQEILSKIRTFTEYDPKEFCFTFRFDYNEDDFGMASKTYIMDDYLDLLTDISTQINDQINDKKQDFACCVQMRYIDEYYKEKENDNMPYKFNCLGSFADPLKFYVNNSETSIEIDTAKERDIGLTVTTTKQPKGSILPFNVLDILSKIKDYKIYNGKALVVWFTDGSFTKAVVSNGEEFDFYTGLMVCLFKKYLGENGSKKFNKMMEVAMKKLGDIDKNKEKQAEEQALAEKKRRKADMKRKAKALKKKEEAIDIQKQGYIRAMQELGEDDRK